MHKNFDFTLLLASYFALSIGIFSGWGQSAYAANTPPSVAIVSPASGSMLGVYERNILTATAADSDGILRVEFYQGNTYLGSGFSAPYSYTATWLPAGIITLTAKAYDRLGAFTVSAPVTVTVIDNRAPTVSLNSPSDGSIYTAPATIDLSAAAADIDGIAKIEFYNGTTLLGTDTTSPYTLTLTNVAAGIYALSARAYDKLNLSKETLPVSVTVNTANTPPVVSLTAPANGSIYTAPASITLNASASDSNGISKVEFYSGATLLGSDTTAPYSWALTNVATGSYSYTAKAFDTLGASATSGAVGVTVNSSNTPPAVSLTAPANGSIYTAPASITLNASASDSNGISKVEFYSGTTLLGSDTTLPYTWVLTNVTPGSYGYTAKAFDTLGASATSAAVNVTVNAVTIRTETVTYYHNDALGSPIAATDAGGNLLWRETYRPYGERLNNQSASSNNPIWYTGKHQDPETGLVYMGARYYNPVLGRFLSIDPVEPDENDLHSLNRYAYANNNPYKFVDPDGQAAETVIDVISLGLSIKAWRQDPSFVNALAVAYDGFATAIPVLPGGLGILRQASSKGGEITQAVRQAADGGAARAGVKAAEGGVTAAKETIVIGEGMATRVIPTAREIGANWYEPRNGAAENFLKNNERWINKKMDQGCRIVDCGVAPGRKNFPEPTSPNYKMEREQINKRNYPVEKVKLRGE